MLVLRGLVRDGVVPLLGPPTSIGDFHHGAWYYYLLSPAAAADRRRLAVRGRRRDRPGRDRRGGRRCGGWRGWWAGPVAGLVAGLGHGGLDRGGRRVDLHLESEPHRGSPVPSRSRRHGGRGPVGGDRRWWLVAAVGTAVAVQCHVLGVALLPIVAVPFLLDAAPPSDRLGSRSASRRIFVLAYVPLGDQRADDRPLSEAGAGRRPISPATGRRPRVAIPVRFGIAGLRVVGAGRLPA